MPQLLLAHVWQPMGPARPSAPSYGLSLVHQQQHGARDVLFHSLL
jgi:hypothetical protein